MGVEGSLAASFFLSSAAGFAASLALLAACVAGAGAAGAGGLLGAGLAAAGGAAEFVLAVGPGLSELPLHATQNNADIESTRKSFTRIITSSPWEYLFSNTGDSELLAQYTLNLTDRNSFLLH
jgi:hypothetical protein